MMWLAVTNLLNSLATYAILGPYFHTRCVPEGPTAAGATFLLLRLSCWLLLVRHIVVLTTISRQYFVLK